MERSAPYALIAGFVLIGLAVAAGLLIWLTDYDPGRRERIYAVIFDDVSGLSLASEVRYNGLPVGQVASMSLDPAGTGLIRVEIAVLEEVPLRQGSVARLSTQGVTGVAVVALEGGDPRAGPLPEGPEGLPVLASGRGAVETLADEAPALLEEARVLIGDLRAFATPENAARVSRVLADLEQGAAGLGELGTLAEDLGGIGRDLAPALRGLPDAIARVEGAAAEAEALATALRGTVETRGPALGDAAERALADFGAAAAAGRARLEEAEALLAAVQAASDGVTELATAGTGTATAVTELAQRAAPLAEEGASVARTLNAGLPSVLEQTGAAAAALRPFAEERLPALADRAAAALSGLEGAARAGEARLAEAEALLASMRSASDEVTRLAAAGTDTATAVTDLSRRAGPLAEEGARVAQTLNERLPALLEETGAIAAALRPFAEARLPNLAEGAQATLASVEEAARTGEARLAEAQALLASMRSASDEVTRLAAAGTDTATAVTDLSRRAGPLAEEGAAVARTLNEGLPTLLEESGAIAGALRPFAEERLPALADAAQSTLASVDGAARAGEARLRQAEPAIRAATEAGESLAALATESRAAVTAADGLIRDVGPVLSDAGAAARALREEVPPALADLRASADAVRAVAADRLPLLAEEAEAVLDAATRLATTVETEIAALGASARTRLDESAPAIAAFGDAARAVEGASTEVEALAGEIAPAVADVAAAGTRLAGSAEGLAAEIAPLAEEARALVGDLRAATGTAQTALTQAADILSDLARTTPDLDRALRGVATAADSVGRLAQRLARDPSILIRGR